MRTFAGALATLAVLATAASAAARDIWLSPPTLPAHPPPLATRPPTPDSRVEFQLPGPVATRETISVGIGPDGTSRSVRVTQRLEITGTGDYSFLVPAPATAAVAGPGSESQPGLRDAGIVWQGFADRRRVLSVTATLRRVAATAGLPLRVAISRRSDATVVRLSNVTVRRAEVTSGRASLATIRAALRDVRAFHRTPGPGAWSSIVDGRIGAPADVDVAAPLHVTGTLAPGVPVDVTLGGGKPLERSFVVNGRTAPRVQLRVELPTPIDILPKKLTDSRRAIETIEVALGALELADAYNRYLPSPDGLSKDVTATYVYRSLPRLVAGRPAGAHDGGSDPLAVALAGAFGVACLAGLAGVWARS
jgi:hypothetical protein